MVAKWFGAGLVLAVGAWGVLIASTPVAVVEPPREDCAVICLKTEPIETPIFPPGIDWVPPPVEMQVNQIHPYPVGKTE